MMAVYENAEFRSEVENEKRDRNYEELDQREEQDKVYTEIK